MSSKYDNGQTPAHAHQQLPLMTRRDDGFATRLKICTITAGAFGMQVVAVRSVASEALVYASSEMECELQGKAKTAIMPIWPPTNEGLRWPPVDTMTQQDVEDWTEMWSKADGQRPMEGPNAAPAP